MRKKLSLFLVIIFTTVLIASNSGTALAGYDKKENAKYTICIDPGHQLKGNSKLEPLGNGSSVKKAMVTSGTSGVATKKPEYVFTLELSMKIKKLLESKGYKVVMTRTKHDVNISNRQRAEVANKAKADLFLRIHADGSPSKETRGASILLPSEKNKFCSAIAKKSKVAAEDLQKTIKSLDKIKGCKLSYRDDMTGFNWSKVPAVLIEAGFMSNPEEDRMLSDKDFQNEMAAAIVEGIENYVHKAEIN